MKLNGVRKKSFTIETLYMDANNLDFDKIDRILAFVEKDLSKRWLRTVSTVLLSLATVLSSWSIYQSSQWGGKEKSYIDNESLKNQMLVQKELSANQRKSSEVQYFLIYMSNVINGNTELSDFMGTRFSPHLKVAVSAWWQLDPLHNPSAPASPFNMKEYVLPELADISKLTDEISELKNKADLAGTLSGNYTLLSLALSMVLFFSGISGVTNSSVNQRILLGTAVIILILVVFFIFRLPVLI
jgi:hypothetical protein